jgi:hypothetical protein
METGNSVSGIDSELPVTENSVPDSLKPEIGTSSKIRGISGKNGSVLMETGNLELSSVDSELPVTGNSMKGSIVPEIGNSYRGIYKYMYTHMYIKIHIYVFINTL